MSFKKLKMNERWAENIQPQYGDPRSSSSNCNRSVVNEQFLAFKENIGKLKSFVCKKLDQMEQTQLAHNKAVMTALAEQKIVTQKLIRQESLGAPIAELFQLSSEESLKAIEEKILPENREIYMSTIKRLLQQSATLNLKNIFDDSVVLSHNLDGTHGKKRLKTYEKLYAALLDSVSQLPKVENAEDNLRKAIRMQKKRIFKTISASKATTPT
ncbi:uncharacterized protein LOC125775491 isoform X2 [Bactrocera dorsalis]|uniref:Uncharacterized protein LOC125775491 isoform X2 n=1 Tax=Bactrocera dorsalis TaxID=27457 RepID=A0ABM3IYQ6_BACDO|nr:uncharacterized protein LOC125775491 isoform X2 [Bactrocera dorsalis]